MGPEDASPLAPGQLEAGNIDLAKRPAWKDLSNPKKIRTIVSSSFNIDGVEVLLPTLDPATGKTLPNHEVISRYRQTGEHLGKFETPDDADRFARNLSHAQGERWRPATSSYGRYDTPRFNPDKYHVRPSAESTHHQVLPRVWEGILDKFRQGRMEFYKRIAGDKP